MIARLRAAVAALALVATPLILSMPAPGAPPEWQQDLDYLTWDRRAEEPTAVGGPVYLLPEGERQEVVAAASSSPSWQLRIRNFTSLVTPRGLWSLVSRREATESGTATLMVPAPGDAVQQAAAPSGPSGPVARRDERGANRTVVR